MRNICLSFSVLALAFAFSGCSKNNNGPSNVASVMFVNGCVLATNINIEVKNVAQPNASNIAFFGTSGYQNVTAGSGILISYYLSNPVTLLSSQTVNLTAGTHYSVFAGNGLVTTPSFLLTTDDLTAPATGYAKIRFVNLSSDSLNETATVGDSTFAVGVTSTTTSGFYQMLAGSYAVKAGDPLHISSVVTTPSTLLAAGKIYTVILTGSESGSGTAGLTLTFINNN
jgi:hypothetical protein